MATLSQNITQAISDFDDIKEAIEDKGVTIPSGTRTSEYADLIGDIPTGGDDSVLKGIINGSAASVTFPQGTASIRPYAFSHYSGLTSVTFNDDLTGIGERSFDSCGLVTVTITSSVQWVNAYAFLRNNNLTNLYISHGVYGLEAYAFTDCPNLSTVFIPNTISFISSSSPFNQCPKLENVTIESVFNCNGLNLSASTLYTAETIVGWLNALKDLTGKSSKTLTIGSANLAKLTAEQIAIATNKNWNLA